MPRWPWRRLLGGCALLLGAAPLAAPGASAPAVTLESLAEDFAQSPGLEARFREERHFAVLAAPLVNEGSLYFAQPGLLLWRVERPARSDLVVRGGELAVTAEGQTRRVDLSAEPAARAFVDAFLRLLQGDLERLRVEYDARVEGDRGGWHIRLTPRSEKLREAIPSLEVSGAGRTPESLRIRVGREDEIRTRFSSVDPERRFSPEEVASLFRIPEP